MLVVLLSCRGSQPACPCDRSRTLELSPCSFQNQGNDEEVATLVEEMRRGEIGALILYGVNPACDYPDQEAFRRGLERVGLSVSFADRVDETALHVHAVCPDHHYLEAWGDAEPVSGSYGLIQPTIAPLFETRAAQDSLLKWIGDAPDFHACLRSYWQRHVYPHQSGARGFDAFWDQALQAGFVNVPARRRRRRRSPAISRRRLVSFVINLHEMHRFDDPISTSSTCTKWSPCGTADM
jgi:anaerobic selenocysteine-containing dehydrogenase